MAEIRVRHRFEDVVVELHHGIPDDAGANAGLNAERPRGAPAVRGFFTSGLPAQADETDGRVVVVARDVGTPPFLTDFAFDLDRAGELVAERRRRSVALV